MNQHTAPTGTVATLGHPGNGILIVKAASVWRYVHSGRIVDDEDFRSGWEVYEPTAPLPPLPVMKLGDLKSLQVDHLTLIATTPHGSHRFLFETHVEVVDDGLLLFLRPID